MVTIVIAMIALVGLIVGAGGIMFWYRDTVTPFQDAIAGLADYTPEHQTARIYDAEGGLIAALNSRETGARTMVPLERISPYMIHAIVAQENKRYFDDPGFDPIAIVRAFLQTSAAAASNPAPAPSPSRSPAIWCCVIVQSAWSARSTRS